MHAHTHTHTYLHTDARTLTNVVGPRVTRAHSAIVRSATELLLGAHQLSGVRRRRRDNALALLTRSPVRPAARLPARRPPIRRARARWRRPWWSRAPRGRRPSRAYVPAELVCVAGVSHALISVPAAYIPYA